MSDSDVVVYYTPLCPFAIRLFVGMRLTGIRYSAVRFRDDEAGAAKVRAINDGNEMSPTVRIGNRFLTNPSLTTVRRTLGASEEEDHASAR